MSLVAILLLLTIVLSFPSAQSWTASKAVNWLNNKYSTQITVKRFSYTFPRSFELHEVYLPDENSDTIIYAKRIDLEFIRFDNASRSMAFGDTEIEHLRFNWLTKEGDSIAGFKKFIDKFRSGTPDSRPFNLDISSVDIENGYFHMENLNCDSCYALRLEELHALVDDLKIKGQFVEGDVVQMKVKDRYSLELIALEGHIGYLQDQLMFEDLTLQTPQSHISGDIHLRYDSITAFADFVNGVTIDADLSENTQVESSDIIKFASTFPDFGRIEVSGLIEGKLNDLQTENLDLNIADATSIHGDIDITDATVKGQMHIEARDVDLQTTTSDIQELLRVVSDTTLPEMFHKLGNISFSGNYTGYFHDFQTNGVLITDIGQVRAELSFQDNRKENNGTISYSGDVHLQEVDLGRLLDEPELGKVTSSMTVDGYGLDPVNMNTSMEGSISRVYIHGYNYRNVVVNGRIEDGFFRGKLNVNDPNLQLRFNGNASFGKDTSYYDFVANLDTANLYALNLSKDTISYVSGDVVIDMMALNYDRWQGLVNISNTTYADKKNFYFFQDILIEAEGLDTNRSLTVRSNILDADVSGDYTMEGVYQGFTYHARKFIKNAKRIPPPPDENFSFDITIKNTLILTEIFQPELRIEPNSRLRGNFAETTRELNVDIESPGFSYQRNIVRGIDLTYNGSDEKSEMNFQINEVELASGFEIDSIRLGNYYYQDTLFYNLRWIFRDSIDSKASLNGYALQQDSLSFEFGIDSSGFNIGTENFAINRDNRILLDTGGVNLENLIVSNEGRSVVINGNISDDPNEILRVNLQGFGLDIANYFIGSPDAEFSGELHGDIIISQILSNPRFAANVSIDSVKMNRTLLGEFNLTSDWTYPNDTINILATLNLGELQTLHLEGFYQPDSLGSINLNARFNQFRLAAFNPLVSGIAENLRGYLEGNISMSGTTGNPEVRGDLILPKAGFTISFLQTDYNFTGEPHVQLLKNKILINDIQLRDTRYRTEGILRGEITHQNFRNFNFGLVIEADELLVLDTEANRDDYYYGTAFATGTISLLGPPGELQVKANVSTAGDTRFNIPLDAATNVSKSDFVTFINPQGVDSLLTEQINRLNLRRGVSIDFNIQVNRNALVQIIVDQEAGTKLETRGNGNINLSMAPYADMQLNGSYTVYEGDFLFSLQGLVRKNFTVQQGGSITWSGDPTEAIVDIVARYETRADPGVIVNDHTAGKTLVYVDLHLTGELQNPNIDFDIITPRATSTTQTVLNNIVSSENQLNQQVFSLLIRNSFAPESNFFGGGGGGGIDLIAQQAAAWINQISGDYEFSLAYQGAPEESLDPEAAAFGPQEEVEVGVSKKFFNDRVTINGSVGVPLGRNQNQIAGDFEIEYSISEDGRLRGKIFNRAVQNQFSFSDQNYQQGVGLFYRVDFNHIFKRDEEEIEQDVIDEDVRRKLEKRKEEQREELEL